MGSQWIQRVVFLVFLFIAFPSCGGGPKLGDIITDVPIDLAIDGEDQYTDEETAVDKFVVLTAFHVMGGNARMSAVSHDLYIGMRVNPSSPGGALENSTYRLHIGLIRVMTGQ